MCHCGASSWWWEEEGATVTTVKAKAAGTGTARKSRESEVEVKKRMPLRIRIEGHDELQNSNRLQGGVLGFNSARDIEDLVDIKKSDHECHSLVAELVDSQPKLAIRPNVSNHDLVSPSQTPKPFAQLSPSSRLVSPRFTPAVISASTMAEAEAASLLDLKKDILVLSSSSSSSSFSSFAPTESDVRRSSSVASYPSISRMSPPLLPNSANVNGKLNRGGSPTQSPRASMLSKQYLGIGIKSNGTRKDYCETCHRHSCPTVHPPKGYYTVEQVALHCRPDDCWVIAHGLVYDVTRFIPKHPGGAISILGRAGGDATYDFDFHSSFAQKKLWRRHEIGKLAVCPALNGNNDECILS